jgi:diguanylate cyclase
MKNAKQSPSIALRLAALMDRERIESLPRNYELLYNVYSGSNPELTREFMALGEVKTQKALDEIGKKYLPHQHEEGVLAKANEIMRSQMSSFLQLIQNESSSLAEFERIIGETSRAISSDKDLDRDAIAKSIDKLSKATVQQFKNNKTFGDAAAAQNEAIGELTKEMEALEARKWTDPITGFANRRSFNKTIVSVHAHSDRPAPCGLVFAEFDDLRNYNTSDRTRFSNQYLLDIAGLFNAHNTSRHFIAYLEKGRFAALLSTEDTDRIMGFVDKIRTAAIAKSPHVVKRNSTNAETTVSIGIAMASGANNAGELIEHAEKALSDSIKAGGNKVTLFSTGEPAENRKNWMIYANN